MVDSFFIIITVVSSAKRSYVAITVPGCVKASTEKRTMRFPVNGEIEWVSHVLNGSQHGEDLKGGSFSQEGEEDAAGLKPSPDLEIKVF